MLADIERNWDANKTNKEAIREPYVDNIPNYNVEHFKVQLVTTAILQKMLETFRNELWPKLTYAQIAKGCHYENEVFLVLNVCVTFHPEKGHFFMSMIHAIRIRKNDPAAVPSYFLSLTIVAYPPR